MTYEGRAVKVLPLDGGLVELRFDLQGDAVNKFNALTLGELHEAVADVRAREGLRGLLITSGKDVFSVGADVTEFLEHFRKSEEELAAWLLRMDALFSAIEDLDAPSVVAINGLALGAASSSVSRRAIARCRQRRESACRRRSSASSPAGVAPSGSPASAGPTPRSSGLPAASSGPRPTR